MKVWQTTVSLLIVLVSASHAASWDEADAKAAQLLADTAIKAAGEARARAVDRIHAEGIQNPFHVAKFAFASMVLLDALDWQKEGEKAFKENKWTKAVAHFIAATLDGDKAYDIYETIYVQEDETPIP